MTRRITLRPARPEDLTLTYTITREAMRGYVKQTWGRWDEAEQVRKHRELYTPQTHRLIVVSRSAAGADSDDVAGVGGATDVVGAADVRGAADSAASVDATVVTGAAASAGTAGAVAGLVATEPWPDDAQCLWLVKLYLLARFRGQGIGTVVLRRVMDEAAALAQPLRLRVLRVNVRAQALYLAHGFRVFEESRERLFMEWRSPSLAPLTGQHA